MAEYPDEKRHLPRERLQRLQFSLRWAGSPKRRRTSCLQELKAPDEKSPVLGLRKRATARSGMESELGTAPPSSPVVPSCGAAARPAFNALHSVYIEAEIGGLGVGSIYLPDRNARRGRSSITVRWFDRLTQHSKKLLASKTPVILAGDYNVMPTDLDVYRSERWVKDALFRPEVRKAFAGLTAQGWTDAIRTLHPGERVYTFWDYFRDAYGRDAGLRIDHLLLSPAVAGKLTAAGVDRHVRGWEKASDHAPTWMTLDVTQQRRRPALR